MILPKLGDVRFVPGSANCGVFRKLMDSARKVRVFSGATFQVREIAAMDSVRTSRSYSG